MATPEQIASILSQLVALHPADCFKPIDAANAGLGAVLRLLYLADQPVTAGTISEKLHHSPASLHLRGRMMNPRPSNRIIQYFKKRRMTVRFIGLPPALLPRHVWPSAYRLDADRRVCCKSVVGSRACCPKSKR